MFNNNNIIKHWSYDGSCGMGCVSQLTVQTVLRSLSQRPCVLSLTPWRPVSLRTLLIRSIRNVWLFLKFRCPQRCQFCSAFAVLMKQVATFWTMCPYHSWRKCRGAVTQHPLCAGISNGFVHYTHMGRIQKRQRVSVDRPSRINWFCLWESRRGISEWPLLVWIQDEPGHHKTH